MSSSGLIYAVIVGAWAAYLVPMWLRRQDELNEARPTERFSTAIRLLSGRAAMERRYAKDLQARTDAGVGQQDDPDGFTGSVDVRALAVPTTERHPKPTPGAHPAGGAPDAPREQTSGPGATGRGHPAARRTGRGAAPPRDVAARRPAARRSAVAEAEARARRSKVLARRRRTTVLLFLAFTLGTVVAAIGGVAFLWAPGVPAVLLSAYIGYLRRQERRRFAYTMDRRRAEAAARRLRDGRRPGGATAASGSGGLVTNGGPVDPPDTSVSDGTDGAPPPDPVPERSALAADRRALVEQTDHAEWVDDQQRERRRGPAQGDSWDPVPVPLPTYVTAPVAPRAGGDIDLGAPDTWSSARSSPAEPPARDTGARRRDGAASVGMPPASGGRSKRAGGGRQGKGRRDPGETSSAGPVDDEDDAHERRTGTRRAATTRPQRRRGQGGSPGARERGRTPLFDQYADEEHPRAAGQ